MAGIFNLRMQHTSLEVYDPTAQKRHDVRSLFENGEDYPVKTGTEGQDRDMRKLLQDQAIRFNHTMHFAADNWVSIDKSIIKPGTYVEERVFIADADEAVGPGADRIMAAARFVHRQAGVGEINVGSVHYKTRGRKPGDPNYVINRRYARKIEAWMKKVGKGTALAFVNGDFNMLDKTQDWAFGEGFTSMADELKAWQNTGHGPIDGFCSYDLDGRVKAKRFTVLDDSERKMYSDHFVCQGVWSIKLLSGVRGLDALQP